ncbi:MAG: DUF2585 family protein [Candidatus Taylorbacteria bacterium]|nr:DUF2585 family protein [Candidatus Taylorbacteria bacterium]
MNKILTFLKTYKATIIGFIIILILVAGIELYSGRSPWGPDGKFAWWDGDVWSNENSQRVADAYSFSHIIHGMLFYAFLWLVARRLPVRHRLLIALLIEAGWELLENSPLIINRYREATIALGYVGDSVLNSTCDVVMAGIGFWIARVSKIWLTIILIIVFELGCLFWVRDNLTLNVIMLVHPSESIKTWQSKGH